MKEKLQKIAYLYIKEYELKTRVDIVNKGDGCYFRRSNNTIFLAIDHVKILYDLGAISSLEKRSGYKDFDHNLIFAILHEIGHAVDYKTNPFKFDKEFFDIDIELYKNDRQYHISRNFEKRADEFARHELNKIVKKEETKNQYKIIYNDKKDKRGDRKEIILEAVNLVKLYGLLEDKKVNNVLEIEEITCE